MTRIRALGEDVRINVSSMGASQLPITTIALAMGLNVRVGMEDNVFYRRGEPLESNAQLVERAVRIARELDREPVRRRRRRANCWRSAGAKGRAAERRARGRAAAVRRAARLQRRGDDVDDLGLGLRVHREDGLAPAR